MWRGFLFGGLYGVFRLDGLKFFLDAFAASVWPCVDQRERRHMHEVSKHLISVALGCEFLKLTDKVRLADDYRQRVCHGANLRKDGAWQGFHPVPMHGVKNAPLLPIRFADDRRQRRADRLRKVGEVSRGIEKRPEGRFLQQTKCSK